ncbi:MAG TPA: hypothetical protein VGQ36_17735 [Thermoanaerobaculia bacterium]|jgi:hypothetical protein|nr:hypothetical protein [Thermoanaerobaculia bacterium]
MAWSTQRAWRRCGKCGGFWFSGAAGQGTCPAAIGGGHLQADTNNYSLVVDATIAPGQSGWRRCSKCLSLWFGGSAQGTCAAGGSHSAAAGSYTVAFTSQFPFGEANWRCCAKCQSLFFAGGAVNQCAAGGGHNPDGTPSLSLVIVDSAVRLHTKVLTTPTGTAIETMMHNIREIYAAGRIDVEWVSHENLNLPDLLDVEVGDCLIGQNPTDEQTALYANRNNVGANEIAVYFVRNTIPIMNGCAAHPGGQPGAIVASIASQWTLAHEIGHVLALQHATGAANSDRLMFNQTSAITNPPPDLIASEIAAMKASGLTVGV